MTAPLSPPQGSGIKRSGGPTWWASQTIYSTNKSQWQVLFEFFGKNAEQYALLRVSASDGRIATKGVFTNEDLQTYANFANFSRAKASKTTDACKILRHVVDERIPGVVNLQEQPQLCISIASIASVAQPAVELQLNMNMEQTLKAFLQQSMQYLSNVQATFQNLDESVQTLQTEYDQQKAAFDAAIATKIQNDHKLVHGTTTLMLEKRKHSSS